MELRSSDFLTLFCVATISVLLTRHAKLQNEILIEIEKLNNTLHANQSILIFNGVPKVHSRTCYIA